jgi:hypothetical protein
VLTQPLSVGVKYLGKPNLQGMGNFRLPLFSPVLANNYYERFNPTELGISEYTELLKHEDLV